MSAPAWMPFYPADYLADTGHLTTVQHGAYLLLILHYWRTGGLPCDDQQLAQICRMPARDWKASRPVLAGFFDADWRHKRIDAEMAKSAGKSAARSAAGRSGGLAKAGNRLANATPMPQQKPADALASSSQSESERKNNNLQQSMTPVEKAPSSAAAWQGDLEQKCREAAGLENDPSPGLLVIGPMFDLVEAGWSLDGHILPRIRGARAAGRTGRSWSYYAKIVTEGASSPPKAPPPPATNRALTGPENQQEMVSAWLKKNGVEAA